MNKQEEICQWINKYNNTISCTVVEHNLNSYFCLDSIVPSQLNISMR